MKKLITGLLANLTALPAAIPLMANQVTNQEIEAMKTKVDLWIEKTRNWSQYFVQHKTSNKIEIYSANDKIKTDTGTGFYTSILNNKIQNYFKEGSEKWFGHVIDYYPEKIVDFKGYFTSPGGNFLSELSFDDYCLVEPENSCSLLRDDSRYKNIQFNFKANINRREYSEGWGNFGIEIWFFSPPEFAEREYEREIESKKKKHIVHDCHFDEYFKATFTGKVQYRIREEIINKLHDKLLKIKEKLQNPSLAEQAYKENLSFMNNA